MKYKIYKLKPWKILKNPDNIKKYLQKKRSGGFEIYFKNINKLYDRERFEKYFENHGSPNLGKKAILQIFFKNLRFIYGKQFKDNKKTF